MARKNTSYTGNHERLPLHLIVRTLQKYRMPNTSENDCWIFQGAPNNSGYGQMGWSVNGYTFHAEAHVIMARHFLLGGAPLPPGHEIHHICGVKLCGNPLHHEIIDKEKHRALHGRSPREERAAHEDEVRAEMDRKGVNGTIDPHNEED